MQRLLVAGLLLLFITVPQVVFGAGVRVSSDVVLLPEETVTDNQYFVGGKVVAQGVMQQDVFAVGGNVEIPGTVQGDVLVIAAESAVITGTVVGDVRVLGSSVEIVGSVAGDVVVIAGSVRLAPEATVSGEILLVGGSTVIDSTLQKHARIVAGTVSIGGELRSSANITTERLMITPSARITGEVAYFSPREAEIQDGATVLGTVTFNKVEAIHEQGIIEQAIVSFLNFWMVLRFVTTLLLTFLLVYVFRVFSQQTTEYVLTSFGRSVLTGLLALIGGLVIATVLFISLILMPVSVLVMLAYLFVGILSPAVGSIAVGALLKRAFSKQQQLEVSFKTAALGVVLLTIVQFVPVVGEATRFIFFLAAFGAVWKYVYDHIRWREMTLFKK